MFEATMLPCKSYAYSPSNGEEKALVGIKGKIKVERTKASAVRKYEP